MILDSNNKNDIYNIMKYGKAKGMILIDKFFPKFNVYDRFFLIKSINDWGKIEKNFDEKLFVRVDYLIGKQDKFIPGRSIIKNQVTDYIEKANKLSGDCVIICIKEQVLDPINQINTLGAGNIHFDYNSFIYIDYVGDGFDASNVTKGQATHESWKIPFDKVLFLDNKTIQNYCTFKINNEAYKEELETRKQELIKYFPNNIKDINSLNENYIDCSVDKLDLIINKIIIPTINNINELKNEVGNEFGIQFNLTKLNEIEIYEINRPERIK